MVSLGRNVGQENINYDIKHNKREIVTEEGCTLEFGTGEDFFSCFCICFSLFELTTGRGCHGRVGRYSASHSYHSKFGLLCSASDETQQYISLPSQNSKVKTLLWQSHPLCPPNTEHLPSTSLHWSQRE